MTQEETVTDHIDTLMISTDAADPVGERLDIPNAVLKEKRRFIPNPKHKPCKQRKLQRAFEQRHKVWSTTKER